MDDDQALTWRRDASTSRLVRGLWAFGAGAFFASIALVVFGRFLGLANATSGAPIVVAALAAVGVTIAALAVAGDLDSWIARLESRIPGTDGDDPADVGRLVDAAVGAVVVGSFMVFAVTVIDGRIGNFLTALVIPLALAALALSTFLRSVGTIDGEQGAIYLYDPEEAIDLGVIEAVSTRSVGEWALVSLTYATPDGTYVPGPRRLLVPPRIAREIEGLVGRR